MKRHAGIVARLGGVLGLVALTVALGAPRTAAAGTIALQGALRTSAGLPVPDGAYVLFFRLYESKDAADPSWEDALAGVQVTAGGFALEVGASKNKAIPDALLTSGKDLFLGVQVASDTELPRVAVGWNVRAYYAQVAGAAAFPYAASSTAGGPALDLQCTGCVTTGALADASVTSTKVAFTYAGSDSKGGAATSALTAESAKAAQTAVQADSATAADVASALQCSGCIGPGHLSAEVSKAYVPVTGGMVTGTLGVDGELALGTSTLSGGRFAAVDVSKATCGAQQLGQVVLDSNTKRLYFCDGSKFRRLSSCLGECKQPSGVACGQPISDDCGDVGLCSGTGTACASGGACVSGACKGPGEVKESAVQSCKALLVLDPNKANGTYWLDPDGTGGPVAAFQAYCEMKLDGGGWTRVDYKSDLAFQNWWQNGDNWRWFASPFAFVLSTAQIQALQGVSTEGKQDYVGQCDNVIHYYYNGGSVYEYAFGFRFLDGTETPFGQQSYAPFDITVPQDGCAVNGGEAGDPAKGTIFRIKSKKVPVVNVQCRDCGDASEMLGSQLTKNPAWLR